MAVDVQTLTRAEVSAQVWQAAAYLAAALPEPRDRVETLFPDGGYGSWNGPPGVGKTFAALDAAIAIATGRKFLGRFETMAGRVLIIDQESHPSRLQARFRALTHGKPIAPDTPLFFRISDGLYVDSNPNDPGSGYQMLRRMLDETQADLFILDSFTRAHTAKENEAGDMADVNAAIKSLMTEFDCGCLVLDHATKGLMGAAVDPGARLRGSTEKLAALDAALFFERSKTEDRAIVCTPSKARWTEETGAFTFEIRSEGEAIRLVHTGEKKPAENTVPGLVLDAINSIEHQLGVTGATLTEIAGWLGVSATTVRKYRDKVQSAGLVREVQRPSTGGKPATAYTVNRQGRDELQELRIPENQPLTNGSNAL